ncbi:MAG: hypothetical protein ACYSUB_12275, partial [Planctomycetota bacterium]
MLGTTAADPIQGIWLPDSLLKLFMIVFFRSDIRRLSSLRDNEDETGLSPIYFPIAYFSAT